MLLSYDQLDSTNRLAKELAAEGQPAGTVVVAGAQSAGRGQYGRAFTSPKGGLYFSLILEPALSPVRLPLATLATGLACRNVLQRAFQLHPEIKWPNDAYLNGKKVAGILCETVLPSRNQPSGTKVVVGVGMNVNTVKTDYPEEIQPIITTLFEEVKAAVELDRLLNWLLEAITTHVARLQHEAASILAEWQRYDYLLNKPVVCTSEGQTFYGVGMGIDAQGFYRVVDRSGSEHSVLGGGQLRLCE